MEDPRNRQYTNGEITVFWKPSKCIHATTCFRELIEVFNPGRRPWINMKGAPSRRIVEVVNKCPTQALEWKYNKDMNETELVNNFNQTEEITPETIQNKIQSQRPAKITIMKDGPIVVEGNFTVIGIDGNKMKNMQMTSFCRCGNSHSMPFCDGRHRKTTFNDNE